MDSQEHTLLSSQRSTILSRRAKTAATLMGLLPMASREPSMALAARKASTGRRRALDGTQPKK